MKTILMVLFLSCVVSLSTIAQSLLLNYQGRITEDGAPFDGTAQLTFALYDANDNQVWEEQHQSIEIQQGIFHVLLGSVDAIPEELFSEHDELYLGITVNDGAEMEPRSRITSVAYSVRSGSAATVDDGSISNAQVASDANISGLKISPFFGDRYVTTNAGFRTGNLGTFLQPRYHELLFENDENKLHFRRFVGGAIILNTKIMTIDFSNERVGIGVESPAYQLHLSQNSAAKPTSNVWTVDSDKRLKKNINSLANTLDNLLMLQGVTYQWIDTEIRELRNEVDELRSELRRLESMLREANVARLEN